MAGSNEKKTSRRDKRALPKHPSADAEKVRELLAHLSPLLTPKDSASLTETYQLGIVHGMQASAALLGMTVDEIRLACGELTAQEMRTVKAVLEWRKSAVLRKAREISPAPPPNAP